MLKEFQKGMLAELYLPVRAANATKALCKLSNLSDDENEARAQRCGCCIPRLNLHYGEEEFEKLTLKFCDASFGVMTVGGQKNGPEKCSHNVGSAAQQGLERGR